MRFLYTLVMYLSLPYLLWHLWWRGRRNPAYRQRWVERFGYVAALEGGPPGVWIHAVSVGEVQASVPLVRRLKAARPDLCILLTTTTPTGADRARAALAEEVEQLYVPYDLPGAVGRFLERVKPGVAVFMETELWPNLIRGCRERGIPVVVVNARLSARSVCRYRRVAGLVRNMLGDVSALAAQTGTDVRRFVDLGLPVERARTTGNLKFDGVLPDESAGQVEILRGQWGGERPVWIAASTHPGEEELALDAHQRVLSRHPAALLLLVPRHPERSAAVTALAGAAGLTSCRLSDWRDACVNTQVVVGDRLGDLLHLYAASDVAFVGGSLVPLGGHNLLEPAALGVPVLTGPHLFNFSDIAGLLVARGAARKVTDAWDLGEAVTRLLSDPPTRRSMGEKGRRTVAQNRGAVERVMGVLEPYVQGQGQRKRRKEKGERRKGRASGAEAP